MFLLNLTWVQFAALLGGISAGVLALYLWDRSRKRLTVPTLRFWVAAERPAVAKHRRRIQQPLSLLLQLASIALLLLALGQLRLGTRGPVARDHVLILDTSAWMAARSPKGTLMEEARAAARAYARALPAPDRLMLVRADALATPATAFAADRRVVEQAIEQSQPGSTALNLGQAFEFARQAQRLQAGRRGEIVYAGAGRVSDNASDLSQQPVANLRVLPVPDRVENCGLKKIGLRRSATAPDVWEILVGVHNYGARPRTVSLALAFGGSPLGVRQMTLAPGTDQNASFEYRARAAGWLEARLLPPDDFPGNDRAVLDLPARKLLKVVVYSEQPGLLRPLLVANTEVEAVFRKPAEYQAQADADILILDRFNPPRPPLTDSVRIEPPPDGSPLRLRSTVQNVGLARWRSDHPLGEGLRAQDLRLQAAQVYDLSPGDVAVAEVEAGPVIVARPGKPKTVVLGFHPVRSAMRYELATPLLFANILRWMAPDTFRRWELNAGSVGTVNVALGAEPEGGEIRVLAQDGSALPFTQQGRNLRFFAGTPGTVRILTGDRELIYSLTLPEMAEGKWTPPSGARRGIPPPAAARADYSEMWPWLALAGAFGLAAEFLLFARRSGRARLLLKALALAAILLALLLPLVTVFESKMAVAVLADTSASVSPQDLKRESDMAARIEKARGRHWTQVIPFAQSTRQAEPAERAKSWNLAYTAGQAGRGTDIEAAVREGIAALPAGRVPRLVLISDGRENLGSVARAAWQARQLGVPIDTIPLPGRPKPDLRLEAVTLPAQAFTGERFPIDVTVTSPRRTEAEVSISAERKVLGSSHVALDQGVNQLRVHASLSAAGAVDLSGTIGAPGLGEVRFAHALTLRRPRVLFVSQDPPGTGAHLFQTLEAAQFQVEHAGAIPASLSDYQLLVLNNWNLEGIAAPRKAEIEDFVKHGGGLLVIGGERNIYVDKKGAPENPLERALPARLAPPRTPEGTCVVLIMDKSSSMEGRKIELARLAAVGVVENLRPIDLVGVLIFDNSFHWSVPIRKAEEKSLIKRVIAGITPDGGTQIAPALAEAYRRILPVNAVYKHIVLLTDGISEEGDSMSLAHEAALRQVTISTVGLGQDVNRSYLEKVAGLAHGKSYFLTDPSSLEQILLRDVMEHTGSTAVERNIKPVLVKKAEILEGVGMEAAPPLLGYVRFLSKPTADVILTADGRDPLLVRWQYGLGRAEVFTSDAKSRWARHWVGWQGFDRFWENVFRDLLPHAQAGEASAEYNSANDELVIDYRLGRYVEEPAKVPDVFVMGPQGFQRPVQLDKVAAGAYRGRVRIDHRQGLFRIRPLVESRAFPEVGFYRQEEELTEYGSNEALLRRISEFTGGRFDPAPRDVFDSAGRTVTSTLRLWPGLLALALLLNLAELVLRKWRGIAEGLWGTRERAARSPQPLADTAERTAAG